MKNRGEKNWLLIKSKDEHATAGGTEQSKKSATRKRTTTADERSDESTARPKKSGRRPATIEPSHPDRIYFPEKGFTKGDLLQYYERIADRLLPFLKDRPVTLERLPNGLGDPDAPHFWQKNISDKYPD